MPSAADSAPWLEARGLTKAYGGVVALDAVSLSLRAGEIRGLIGANGAGKSTLVKALTGVIAPTAGEVLVDGRPLSLGRPKESLRAGIASVPQELTVASTMTVAENVMLGHEPRRPLGLLREREMRRETQHVLESLSIELRPSEIVGRLTLIEQRLVMIARALSFSARLVIFDEPTATVSPREVELLLGAIRALSARNVSVLYVSHRLGEVEDVCDAVTMLRDGRVVAEVREDAASHAALVELLAPDRPRQGHVRAPRLRPRAREVLAVHALEGERLHGVDLSVQAGEIVGLAGLAGSGARELLLTICGAVPFAGGTIELDGRPLRSGSAVRAVRAGVAYLPGDRSLAAFPGHSVQHNISISALGRHAAGPFVRRASERRAVADVQSRVGLKAQPQAPIASLSGGNQQKAIVARWVMSGSGLLLLDDPTAGVDVSTRPEIQRQIFDLCEAGAAVLLVSTDIDELVELCDRVAVFDRGRITDELSKSELDPARLLAAMTRKVPAPAPG